MDRGLGDRAEWGSLGKFQESIYLLPIWGTVTHLHVDYDG